MTITIKLDPKAEADLLAEAQAHGLSLERYIEHIIYNKHGVVSAAQSLPLDSSQRAGIFRAWVENHDYRGSPLPDQAMRRDAMVRETEWTS